MSSIATVGITDFDRGVVTTIGGKLIDIQVDNGTRKAYAVTVDGVKSKRPQYNGDVPVFFSFPEDVFQPYVLPCFVVKRGEPTPAFERSPWWGWIRRPSEGALKFKVNVFGKEVEGYSSYDTAWKPVPFNMSYDVTVMGRTEHQAIGMLMHLLSKGFRPPYSSVEVYDSNGDRRLYDAGPISISDSSELSDVANRVISWIVNFEVQGELDLMGQDVHSIDNDDHNESDGYLVLDPELNIYRIGRR